MEEGTEVQLYIYDLSMGLAQQLSQLVLGKFFVIFKNIFFSTKWNVLNIYFFAVRFDLRQKRKWIVLLQENTLKEYGIHLL